MNDLLVKRLAGLAGGAGVAALAGWQTSTGWAWGTAQPQAWGLAVAALAWLLCIGLAERCWAAPDAWQQVLQVAGGFAFALPLAMAWRAYVAVQASAARPADHAHVSAAGAAVGGSLLVVAWALLGICTGVALIALGRHIGRPHAPDDAARVIAQRATSPSDP